MMRDAEWKRAKELFSAAIDLPDAERERYFREQADAEEIASEARSLLAAYLDSPDFLEGVTTQLPKIEAEAVAEQGRRIGVWRLVREIGRGGMGVVWEAGRDDGQFEQRAALKLLRASLFADRDQRRFREERQILASLDHPSIARLLDGGMLEDRAPYLVMEYIDGLPIDQWCEQQQLGLRQRIELCLEVCEAVEYAHSHLVIHRDLKSANILVGSGGKPKLLDFGIARLIAESGQPHDTTTRLLTPECASPEQILGGRMSTATDVFALGVLFYKLFAGRHPFVDPKSSSLAAMRAVCEDDPRLPSSVAGEWKRELRGEMDAIILQALRKDPAERYSTVHALAADLQAWLDGLPVSAVRQTWWRRSRKTILRYKALSAAITAAVVLLVAGIVVTSIEARRALRAEHEAIMQRDRAQSQQRRAQAERDRAIAAEGAAVRAESEAAAGRIQAQMESRRADQQAATSKAINAFLQNDLLAQASSDSQATPQTDPDPDLKVRTALDRAARQIGNRFAGQPLVEAAIRESIAGSYYGLGRFEEARTQFERAVDLRRTAQGAEAAETLACMKNLAMTYGQLSQYDKAEALLRQVWTAQRRLFGVHQRDTISSAAELGVVYDSMGRYADAEPLLAGVLNARRRSSPDDQKLLAEAINDLARLYTEEGKFQLAEPLTNEGLALSRRINGESHPLTILLLGSLKRIYLGTGRLEQAEQTNLLELDAIRRTLGPEHPKVLPALNDLGVIYRRQGRFAQSVDTLKQLVAVSTRVWGAENEYTLSFESNLAATLEAMGRLPEAAALAERNFATLQRVYGDTYRWTLATGRILSLIDCAEGQYARAESLLINLAGTIGRVQGFEHPNYATAQAILGQAYLGESRLDEADQALGKAIALDRKVSPGSAAMRMALTTLARLRLSQQRAPEAEALLREAMTGPESQNLQIWDGASRRSLLGASLAAQGRYAEAEPLLLSSYEDLKKLDPNLGADASPPEAGQRIVSLYSAWGKPEKAAAWRKTLAVAH